MGTCPCGASGGAQVAVLLGDPSKQGLFAMRLKVPKGYSIPPHSHPRRRGHTVVSGTINLGMEETADQSEDKGAAESAHFTCCLSAWPTLPASMRRLSSR